MLGFDAGEEFHDAQEPSNVLWSILTYSSLHEGQVLDIEHGPTVTPSGVNDTAHVNGCASAVGSIGGRWRSEVDDVSDGGGDLVARPESHLAVERGRRELGGDRPVLQHLGLAKQLHAADEVRVQRADRLRTEGRHAVPSSAQPTGARRTALAISRAAQPPTRREPPPSRHARACVRSHA